MVRFDDRDWWIVDAMSIYGIRYLDGSSEDAADWMRQIREWERV